MRRRSIAPANSTEHDDGDARTRSREGALARGRTHGRDDEDEDDAGDDDDAGEGERGEREWNEIERARLESEGETRRIPFIWAVAIVTATAVAGVCAQSSAARESALALASVRLSETNVDLSPMTMRLREIERVLKRLEEADVGSDKAVRELRVMVEKSSKDYAAAAAKDGAKENASAADFKALEATVVGLKTSQGKYVTNDSLTALKTADAAAEKRVKALSDDVSAAVAQIKTLETSLAALKKSVSTSEASSAKDIAALSSAGERLASLMKNESASGAVSREGLLAQISALSSSVDALTKTRGDFATAVQMKDVEKKIEALSSNLKSGGVLKKGSESADAAASAKLSALQNDISVLKSAQNEFVTIAQLSGIDEAISVMKKNQAEFAKAQDLRKIEALVADKAAQPSDFASLEKQMTERIEQYIKSIPRSTKGSHSKQADESSNLWFADRTGRPDFALASGGGRVVAHSQVSPFVGRGDGPITSALTYFKSGVHPRSDEWLLTPSMEQPGDCLALHSSTGFVDVRLRQPISVNAVTIEHSNSLIAYDMHSAPRDFGIFGWLSVGKKSKAPKSISPLGNFSYSVDLGAVQTFEVVVPHVVDHVRLFVKNNHGHKGWTCLYRLRVHGTPVNREP